MPRGAGGDSGDASELWRFATAAGGLAAILGIVFAGLPLGGGLAGFAILFGVVAFAAREPAPAPLGLANRLTLARLAVIAALAGCALAAAVTPEARRALAGWTPCVVYTLAVLGDYADGAIARRTRTTSRFGARLDAEADALGLAAASGIAALGSGVLPLWYLAAGFARYLFGGALLLEARLGRRPRELPPSAFRRRLAGFQMGLVAVCLAPFIEPAWAPPATLALGAPFLAGFGRDYLIASGRLDPDGLRSRRFLSRLERLRSPASGAAAVLAVVLGAAKLAGLPTGSWFLAAFFFAWLMRPPRPGARRRSAAHAG